MIIIRYKLLYYKELWLIVGTIAKLFYIELSVLYKNGYTYVQPGNSLTNYPQVVNNPGIFTLVNIHIYSHALV
jgi:hypothetical protein